MADDPLEAAGQPEVEAPPRPDWLERNFNTVEDQARSYTHARREMQEAQRRASEAEQYAQQLQEEMEAAYEEPPQPAFDPSSNPLVQQYQAAYEAGDAQTMLAINAYAASQLVDQRLAQQQEQQPEGPDQTQVEMYALMTDNLARDVYENTYGEPWDEIRRDAAELLMQFPELVPQNLSPQQSAERLVWAAKTARNEKLLAGNEQPATSQPGRPNRLLAQTLTGAGQAPVEEDAQAKFERIKNTPLDSYSALRNQAR